MGSPPPDTRRTGIGGPASAVVRRAAGRSRPDRRVDRVVVIGTGVIGTSVGLALCHAGVQVRLSDVDEESVRTAERMGAGTVLVPGDPPADVVVVATPPATVATVLRRAQAARLGAVYTDVASTKAGVLADAERAGCDLASYLPGHPMAGSERSGPAAARADLFANRPWALCPHPTVSPGPMRVVAELAARCGAVPTVLTAERHDRIVATVSHVPHLVSAALAARFANADPATLSLVGDGLRDTTRVAAGAPDLWRDILEQNSEQVATALDAVVDDLVLAIRALRDPSHAGQVLTELLSRGNQGRARVLPASPA